MARLVVIKKWRGDWEEVLMLVSQAQVKLKRRSRGTIDTTMRLA